MARIRQCFVAEKENFTSVIFVSVTSKTQLRDFWAVCYLKTSKLLQSFQKDKSGSQNNSKSKQNLRSQPHSKIEAGQT